jgi:hypothetical protein
MAARLRLIVSAALMFGGEGRAPVAHVERTILSGIGPNPGFGSLWERQAERISDAVSRNCPDGSPVTSGLMDVVACPLTRARPCPGRVFRFLGPDCDGGRVVWVLFHVGRPVVHIAVMQAADVDDALQPVPEFDQPNCATYRLQGSTAG